MSTETERRLGDLLDSSQGTMDVSNSSSTSSRTTKGSSCVAESVKPVKVLESDAAKEKLNLELKRRQEKMKVFLSQCYLC